jgi:hypothetical protein
MATVCSSRALALAHHRFRVTLTGIAEPQWLMEEATRLNATSNPASVVVMTIVWPDMANSIAIPGGKTGGVRSRMSE